MAEKVAAGFSLCGRFGGASRLRRLLEERQKDWVPQYEDVVLSPDQTGTGITNVHSGSDQVSPFEGTPYSSW